MGILFCFGARGTVGTRAHEFEDVEIDFVTCFALKMGNQCFEVAVVELLGFAAQGTDEMMRVLLRARRVTVAAVRKMDALDVTEFGEQIERAIHGDQTKMRIFFAREFMDFGRREMMVGARDNVENRLTRAREFAAVFAQSVAHVMGYGSGHFFLIEKDFRLELYSKQPRQQIRAHPV